MEDARNRAEVIPGAPGPGLGGFPEPTGISIQLRRIIQLSGAMEGRLARSLGVNHTDLQVMQHLMQSGALAPSELARRVGVTAAATTQAVDRLVAQGHAHRAPHPEDGRRVLVQPEPASIGRAASEILPLISGVTELTTELSAHDTEVISRFLARVVAVYSDVLGEDSAGHPPR